MDGVLSLSEQDASAAATRSALDSRVRASAELLAFCGCFNTQFLGILSFFLFFF